jgi:hypothetical protein
MAGTMSREHLSKTTKLASALLALGDVPYDDAKIMHEKHIISLYDFHHNKRASEDGGNHFSNLEPMLRAAHRERTRKIDVPEIAKNKRIQRKQQEFLRSLWRKDAGESRLRPRSQWPAGRKIESKRKWR